MASWIESDEDGPQDFKKILEDAEGEDFHLGYESEESLEEAEGFSEDESIEEWNKPAPAVVSLGTTSSVFHDEFRPLPMTCCHQEMTMITTATSASNATPELWTWTTTWNIESKDVGRSRSSKSPRASTSAAADSGSPSVLKPSDVVVLAPCVDDDSIPMEEDHNFHLADEHHLYQRMEDMVKVELIEDVVEEQPQQQRRPPRGGVAQRRGAAQRGRGRRRGSRGSHGWMPIGDPQWVRGERLVEVFVDDDDVPEDLRAEIMNIVNAREVARGRLFSRERRAREQNEEEAGDNELNPIFDAEGTSNHFEWSSMGDFQGEREQFLPQQTGAVVVPVNAYGAFRQYWDDDIMTHIVTETNRYAAGLARSSAWFAQSWYDTNVHELFILFSFWMMLGIIRMPSIESCFTKNPILETNIFRKMFTRSRYEDLCRAFHLVDNSSRPTDTTDPLFALGPIIDHLNSRFQESYIPSQNVCIDESLTSWKGNLPFRQYIKTKAAHYRVKTYELCESSTGYLWSFFLGASGVPSTVLESTTTVVQLIRPLLDKGYTLFMDNWFNSPLLARFLKTRKTDCVGTLRVNRANVPPLISLCQLKEGQFVARHSGDVVVSAFQDKKRKIATISTYHGNSQDQIVSMYKPHILLDYDMGMGGVVCKDEILEPYLLVRKSKWYVKFFKRLLNCSIFNARVLLQSSRATNPQLQMVFRLELVDQIMRHHLEHVPKLRKSNKPTVPIHASHFPRKTDQHTNDGRRFKQRRCKYCASQYKKRRNTSYVCSACEVPLCVDTCFEAFHKM